MSQTTFFGAHFSIILGLVLFFIGIWMILKNSQSTAWGWFWVVIGGILVALGFIEMAQRAKLDEINKQNADLDAWSKQFGQSLAAAQSQSDATFYNVTYAAPNVPV